MESGEENVTFKVMVTFPNLLQERIETYNARNGTDFKIVETIYDEVPFCKIQVNNLCASHVFNLAYGLAVLQYRLRDQGELEW